MSTDWDTTAIFTDSVVWRNAVTGQVLATSPSSSRAVWYSPFTTEIFSTRLSTAPSWKLCPRQPTQTLALSACNPATVTPGQSTTLSATNVTDTGAAITSVKFYRGSVIAQNLVGAGVQNGNTWTLSISTTGSSWHVLLSGRRHRQSRCRKHFRPRSAYRRVPATHEYGKLSAGRESEAGVYCELVWARSGRPRDRQLQRLRFGQRWPVQCVVDEYDTNLREVQRPAGSHVWLLQHRHGYGGRRPTDADGTPRQPS